MQKSKGPGPADPNAKRAVLRALRQICAQLRQAQREPTTVRAYREVEALLAAAEQCVPSAPGTNRARPPGRTEART